MDYGRLDRKDLQALCKQHGIPANKTNAFMAEALTTLLKEPKISQLKSEESIPDPADVVKAKAKRAAKTKSVSEVLAASEIDALSSSFAKSTAVVDASDEIRIDVDVPIDVGNQDAGLAEAAPSKATRKPRSKVTKKVSKELLVEAGIPEVELAPEAMQTEETIEVDCRPVVPAVPSNTSRKGKKQSKNVNPATVDVSMAVPVEMRTEVIAEAVPPSSPIAPTSIPSATYSRRGKKEQMPENVEINNQSLAFLSSEAPAAEAIEAVIPVDPSCLVDITPTCVENISIPSAFRAPEELSAAEEEVVVVANLVPKKSRGKAKKSKKGSKSVDTVNADSPAFVPAVETIQDSRQAPVTEDSWLISPVEFEFQPVAKSVEEIFSPRPVVAAKEKACTHRRPVKPVNGKSCKSCESEKTVVNLMKSTLEVLEKPSAREESTFMGLESPATVRETELASSILNNKENSIKNVNLESLSLRKLQAEVRKKGLSKRVANSVKV